MYSPPLPPHSSSGLLRRTEKLNLKQEVDLSALKIRKNLERVTRLYWSTCLENSSMRIEEENKLQLQVGKKMVRTRNDSVYNRREISKRNSTTLSPSPSPSTNEDSIPVQFQDAVTPSTYSIPTPSLHLSRHSSSQPKTPRQQSKSPRVLTPPIRPPRKRPVLQMISQSKILAQLDSPPSTDSESDSGSSEDERIIPSRSKTPSLTLGRTLFTSPAMKASNPGGHFEVSSSSESSISFGRSISPTSFDFPSPPESSYSGTLNSSNSSSNTSIRTKSRASSFTSSSTPLTSNPIIALPTSRKTSFIGVERSIKTKRQLSSPISNSSASIEDPRRAFELLNLSSSEGLKVIEYCFSREKQEEEEKEEEEEEEDEESGSNSTTKRSSKVLEERNSETGDWPNYAYHISSSNSESNSHQISQTPQEVLESKALELSRRTKALPLLPMKPRNRSQSEPERRIHFRADSMRMTDAEKDKGECRTWFEARGMKEVVDWEELFGGVSRGGSFEKEGKGGQSLGDRKISVLGRAFSITSRSTRAGSVLRRVKK